jgi:hypothetical protein
MLAPALTVPPIAALALCRLLPRLSRCRDSILADIEVSEWNERLLLSDNHRAYPFRAVRIGRYIRAAQAALEDGEVGLVDKRRCRSAVGSEAPRLEGVVLRRPRIQQARNIALEDRMQKHNLVAECTFEGLRNPSSKQNASSELHTHAVHVQHEGDLSTPIRLQGTRLHLAVHRDLDLIGLAGLE